MDGVAAVPAPLPQAEAVRVAAVATAAAGEDEDWGVFELQPLIDKGPSGRAAAAAHERREDQACGWRHAARGDNRSASTCVAERRQRQVPAVAAASGWRSWPLDKLPWASS